MPHVLNGKPIPHAALMVTNFGKARSGKAASSWFSTAARDAGIIGKSAHGLRKYRATVLANNLASTHLIAAWLGHDSLAMVRKYTKTANRRRIGGTVGEQKSSNSSKEVPISVVK